MGFVVIYFLFRESNNGDPENKGSYHLYKSLWGFHQVTIGLTVHEYLVTPALNSHPDNICGIWLYSHYSFNFVSTLICFCNFHISHLIIQFFLTTFFTSIVFNVSNVCKFCGECESLKEFFSPFLTVSVMSHMSNFTWGFELPEGHTWKGEQDSQCQSRPCYK